MPPDEGADSRARSRPAGRLWLIGLGLLAAAVVYQAAWISDDAIITFRYVWNLRHGYGAVFNVGDRVQGYTHPLWFAILSAVTVVTSDEVYAAVALGVGLTFATVVLLGSRLLALGRSRLAGGLVTALLVAVFVTSDTWRAFQTSGLEGCLSTFLMVLFVLEVARARDASSSVLLVGSLLALCRPDFALVVTPPCALVLGELLRSRAPLRRPLLALSPLLGFVVIRLYYGDVLPNTAAAKLGIFTLSQGTHQGLLYLLDWAKNEPVTAAACAALLVTGAASAARRRDRDALALLVGLLAYLVYLVVIGGDFMRGRLLLPVFVGACTFGGVALARALPGAWGVKQAAVALAAVAGIAALATTLAPAQTRDLDHGIVNERTFYLANHSLVYYRRKGSLPHDEQEDMVAAYLKACGKVTIHSTHPAALGYHLGPNLTMIDTLGLTDRFIAHLPKSHLRYSPGRPGHPYKRIPIAYLASRQDVSILDDWEAGARKLDCAMVERVKPFESDPGLFHP